MSGYGTSFGRIHSPGSTVEGQNVVGTLKDIFSQGNFRVQMDRVVFLSTKWEMIRFEDGEKLEKNYKEAWKEDVKKGLAFGQLPLMDPEVAWCVTDGILHLMVATGLEGSSKKLSAIADEMRERAWKKAEEKRKMADENSRVRIMQREVDELYAELGRTEYGKSLQSKFRKVSEEQDRIMGKLLREVDREGLKPKEKEKLEEQIKDEYNLFLREFRGHFAEVRAMRIVIGPHLREFYGLLEPVSDFA
ncbi:hypothetical protein NP233_g2331 [Leucocoprinus birnbaumii]|uniref:Uncharacterized protein n=1 Tax=Leucocoprinus birnbaumii TaxID=56174 RepID=A0AAD5W0I3_9AGAR|nr:hypothetical protein NP233_g2331 [Leucocoprinus birnbaumii]